MIPKISARLAFAVLASFGAGAAVAETDTCPWSDQLVCACDNAGISITDPKWRACFLGDVNYTNRTQIDPLSARSFSALNWPVKIGDGGKPVVGVPDLDAKRQGDWTPVWATWKSTRQVFQGGQAPIAWDSSNGVVPKACQDLDLSAEKAKVTFAESIPSDVPPRLLNEYLNPEGFALIDGDGVPVRYDVIFNKQAYDYVANNTLWDARALEQYIEKHGKLNMPVGTWNKGKENPARRGAIVLKTSWKTLSETDDPTLFHKQWAYITPVIENGRRTHECQLKPVGLIGMHIAYKTAQMPDWVWGTFEHVNVAPTWPEVGATISQKFPSGKPTPDWLFYALDFAGAPSVNVPPKSALTGTPTRIVKSYPPGYYFGTIGADGRTKTPCKDGNQEFYCINELMQGFFEGSVFKNYQLIGSQWRQPGSNYAGLLVPEILGNATMETYTQAKSSCINCHSHAGPADQPGKQRVYDFIFSFKRDVSDVSVPTQSR